MAHKFDPEHLEVLHTEERKRIFPAEKAVELSGCSTGDIVVDIGCGSGYLTIPAAQAVGSSGMVYGIDTSERMLEVLNRQISKLGISNIKTLISDEYKLPLEDGICSRAVMSSVFHEVDDRILFARAALDVLVSGGTLTIFEMIPGVVGIGPPEHHRVSSETVASDLEKAGYTIADSGNMNGFFYYVTGRK